MLMGPPTFSALNIFLFVVASSYIVGNSSAGCPAGTYCPNSSRMVPCPLGRYGPPYSLLGGGKCRKLINTTVDCGAAAGALLPGGTFGPPFTASPDGRHTNSNFPSGCYYTSAGLKFNLAQSNTGFCSSTNLCICDNSDAAAVDIGCSGLCPMGKFGSTTGETSESAACAHNCPIGKHGKNVSIAFPYRNNEDNSCACDAPICPGLCPAGRFADGGSRLAENGCPTCRSGRYKRPYALKTSGQCKNGFPESLAECNEAAAALAIQLRQTNLVASDDFEHGASYLPKGCYYLSSSKELKFNGGKTNYGFCKQEKICLCKDETTTVEVACPKTCPSGRYGSVRGASSLAEACLKSCPLGKKKRRGVGASTEAVACEKCPNGKFGVSPGLCADCPAGFAYAGQKNRPCELCEGAKGSYADIAGLGSCKVCPQGTKSIISLPTESEIASMNHSELGLDFNIPSHLSKGCDDDFFWFYVVGIGAGVFFLCFCIVFTKRASLIEKVEHVRQSYRRNTEFEMTHGSDGMNIAIAIQDFRAPERDIQAKIGKLKMNLEKKSEWKGKKINFISALTTVELLVALNALKSFLDQYPEFRVSQEELFKLASQKKATLSLQQQANSDSTVLAEWNSDVEYVYQQILSSKNAVV